MSSFEALYGRKCNTPLNQNDLVNKVHTGLDMLKEIEHEITTIRNNLNIS